MYAFYSKVAPILEKSLSSFVNQYSGRSLFKFCSARLISLKIEFHRLSTVPAGFSDLGFSDHFGFSDQKLGVFAYQLQQF